MVTEWLRQPAEPSRLRDELLFKLFFGRLLPPQDTRQQLERYQSRMEKDLAFYTQLHETALNALTDSPDMSFRLMTIRNGMIITQAALAWCDESLQTLQELGS